MKLVDDAAEWKRWWSMRWLIFGAVCESLRQGWPLIPEAWVSALPSWVPEYLGLATLVSFIAAGVSRVIKQPEKPE